MSGSIDVRGGAYSVAADFDDLRQVAQLLDATASAVESAVSTGLRQASSPNQLPSAVLDPVGAAEVAAAVFRAVATATLIAAACRAVAVSLRAAASSYEGADILISRGRPLFSAVTRLPAALSGAASQLGADIAAGGFPDALNAASRLVEADPALAAALLDAVASGGRADGIVALLANPTHTGSATTLATAALATRFPDGKPVLTHRPNDPTVDLDGPPRSVADLVTGLAHRNDHTTGGGIDIRFIASASPGPRHVIVDITGTKDWRIGTGINANVADLATNLRAISNQLTSYELGVLLALHHSGVRPDDQLMLVGHSQGGLVAARLAADLHGSTAFQVTHLVTAGSPIGMVDVPRNVQTLSLENSGDVVPELDGIDNARRRNQLTVRTDRGANGLGARHSLTGAYLPAAADVDASSDPSLRAWRASAAEFFNGDAVTSRVFEVGRVP